MYPNEKPEVNWSSLFDMYSRNSSKSTCLHIALRYMAGGCCSFPTMALDCTASVQKMQLNLNILFLIQGVSASRDRHTEKRTGDSKMKIMTLHHWWQQIKYLVTIKDAMINHHRYWPAVKHYHKGLSCITCVCFYAKKGHNNRIVKEMKETKNPNWCTSFKCCAATSSGQQNYTCCWENI